MRARVDINENAWSHEDWTGPSTLAVSLLPSHLGFLDGIMKTLETVLAVGFHHVGDPGVLFIMETISSLRENSRLGSDPDRFWLQSPAISIPLWMDSLILVLAQSNQAMLEAQGGFEDVSKGNQNHSRKNPAQGSL